MSTDRAAALQARRRRWRLHPLIHPWHNAVLSIALIAGLCWMTWRLVGWAVIGAVLEPDGVAQCREAAGACWAFVQNKALLLGVGLYPQDALWRPAVAMVLLAGLLAASAVPAWWSRRLAAAGLLGIAAIVAVLHGGFAGLKPVRSDEWGGFMLTLLLAFGSTLLAFPAGVLLALGRRSSRPVVRLLATGYIELFRSIPLLTVLFAAAVILPLFMPGDIEAPKVLRALVGIALCMAAYIAEAVRGGLNAVPKGQIEAAQSIALGYWKTQALVVLPQALKHATPALVTTFLDFFKSTSLVLIIGVFDLMGAARASLADSQWQAFFVEMYVAVAAIYFIVCLGVSRYAGWLEHHLRKPGGRA